MIIRCERCSTLYELDESLLAPEGSDVQCARCQHVFRALPPGAAGRTLQGMPAAASAPPPPERSPSPGPAPPPPAPAVAEPARPALSSAAHTPARYTPGAGPHRPPISQPGVPRPPLLRRDAVGTFESRLRWSHRWKWLGPTLFLVAVGVGVVAFLLRESVVDPRALQAHQRALEVAYRDDLASLEQARAQLDEAIRMAPRLHSARADRALVQLLTAGALLDASAGPGASSSNAKGEALAAEATRTLDELERNRLAVAEVARARAVAAGLGADRALAKRLATAARGTLADDPLVQAAEQSVELRVGERAARERAVGALAVLVSRRPEVLRARLLLARGQVLAGRRAEALATLEGLLRANPRHEGGRALKDALGRATPAPIPAVTTSPAPPVPVPAAPPAARAEKPGLLPRKPDSPAGEPATASSGGARANADADRPLAVDSAAREAPGTPAGAAPGAPAAAGTAADRQTGDVPVAPRLKPAAIPEPEPVQHGG